MAPLLLAYCGALVPGHKAWHQFWFRVVAADAFVGNQVKRVHLWPKGHPQVWGGGRCIQQARGLQAGPAWLSWETTYSW